MTLNAGSHDITLNNAGNTFGTLTLSGRNASVTEAADTELGAAHLSGNLTLLSSGVVTQSGALAIGGNLDVSTTVAAGDVSIDNSAAAATTVGDTRVGGSYVLVATGQPVAQAAGANLQVKGNLTVTGASITLGGAGNLIDGTINLPATSTVELRAAGVITLGDRTETGNLTVVSERSLRSFGSSVVSGSAVVLNNPANHVNGSISVSASPPTVVLGADVQTGIVQSGGTSLSVAGVASFTAEASTAGSLGIVLMNNGNNFGTLQLSGTTVSVKNSALGLTTIAGAAATTSLTLDTAGGIAQTGPIATPALAITALGSVTLNHVANDVATLAVTGNGQAISYVDANGFAVAGIDAGHAAVTLTAGGAGSITQTAALANVSTLTLDAGGAITLQNSGNTVDTLTATAATGLQFSDSAGGLAVAGNVRTATGDLLVRTAGDLTLNSGSHLQADTGNVVASTEGAGNFINNAGASALVVGGGHRWLVYSDTPDLAPGAHTVKGGLTSNFRHYGANLGSYAVGAVTESGNGFIYNDASPTLTVSAVVNGAATHVYGSNPTGTLGYAVSAGLVDSEDSTSNIITGGAATYSGALANTMNAGGYSFLYSGGLVSSYALAANITGVAYTVTPAVLTYNANAASRTYGALNPAVSGTLTGFKLGQTASVLGGSISWTTPVVAGTNVGSHAIAGSGYTSGNYTFTQAAANSTALAITQAGLTVTAGGFSKTYDGTAYSGGAGVSYSAFANGEDASVLGGSLAYAGSAQGARNAGSTVITPTGLVSGNYAITYVSGTLLVSRASLTLAASDVSKTYDGSLAVAGSAVATQLFGSDSVSGGSFAFSNANAGSGNKTVSTSGVTVHDGHGGNNYTVTYADNTTSTINRASLTVASSNVGKTYDGTLAAAGTAVVVGGTLFHNASNGNAMDTLSGGTFAYTDANAGSGNKTVSTRGVTVADGNGGGNYNLGYADNTTSTIAQKALTFSGTIASKVYDGSTAATLAGATLGGLVGSETLGATAATATFADPNAAAGKTVNLGGLALTDGSGLAANYSLGSTATATGTITTQLLTATPTIAGRVYDGSNAAALQGIALSGFVGNESLTGVSSGSTTFVDKNAGTGKAVTVTGVGLTGGSNGGLVGNYTVATTATGHADITAAQLQVSGVVGLNKIYDGALTANLSIQSALLTGTLGADDVRLASIAASFLTKDVASGKAMVTGAYVLNGNDALNYTLLAPGGVTASITPRTLAVTASGVDKVYDTTVAANVTLADNRVANDVLAISANASFADKNVGAGKFIGVSGIAVTGADAGNYVANTGTATLAAITRATLTISATAADKVYDAATGADVGLGDNRLGSDVLSLGYAAASFGNKNAGTDKAVHVSGIVLAGSDAGNYSFNTTASTSADITPADITAVNGYTAATKVYDGSTAATLGNPSNGSISFVGMLAGDSLSASATGAVFGDKNAGVGKAVTVNGLRLGGTDAGNYTLQSTTGATTGTITQATLTVSATAANKVYDGSSAATATLSDNRIGGDALSITATASFLDKNAGAGKFVNVSGIALAGADAGNYTANGSATTYASIAKAALTVSAVGVNKTYDTGTEAGVTLADNRLGGDQLSLGYGHAAFADKNAGAGKTVTVSGIDVGGADAGNYSFNTAATTRADIAKAALTVSAVAATKVYDGSAAAPVTLSDNRLGNDVLNLAYASAGYADKNAGSAKTVTVNAIRVTGADAGNYDVNATATTTAAITPAALTVGAVAQTKPYDGSSAASVTLTDNRVAGDDLVLTHGSATFADGSAGSGKTVSVGDIALGGGADRANYLLANTSATTLANIGAAPPDTSVTSPTLPPVLPPVLPPSLVVPTVAVPVALMDTTLPRGFPGAVATDLGNLASVRNSLAGSAGAPVATGSTGTAATAGAAGTAGAVAATAAPAATGTTAAPAATGTTAATGGATLAAGSALASGLAGAVSPAAAGTEGATANSATGIASPTLASGTTDNSANANANAGGGGNAAAAGAAGIAANRGTSTGTATGSSAETTGNTGTGGGSNQSGTAVSGGGTGVGVSGGSTGGAAVASTGAATAGSSGNAKAQSGDSAMATTAATSSGVGTAGTASTAAGGDESGKVSVSLVRAAGGKENGLVSVSVPQSFTTQGKDFGFPLPVEIAKAAGSGKAKVTRMSGAPLPAWLSYEAKTRTFSVTGAPAGALPVQLLVRFANQRWAVDVTERKGG